MNDPTTAGYHISTNDFVYVKSSKAYGLWEFYPEKQREREKQKNSKTENASIDEEENKSDKTEK